jgi:phage tail-like protein
MAPTHGDWLIEQLPRVMQEDPFLRGFVGITQEIASSLRDEIEKIDYFLDTELAPEEFVRWIGGWLGLAVEPVAVDPAERERRVRGVVEAAGELFLRRGTRAGLEGMLHAITGEPARVSDSGGVFRTGQAPANQKHVVVRIRSNGGVADQSLLRLVQQEMPVDVTFDLLIAGRRVSEEAPVELGHLEDVAEQIGRIERANWEEPPRVAAIGEEPVIGAQSVSVQVAEPEARVPLDDGGDTDETDEEGARGG